jgi:hypothetical protein
MIFDASLDERHRMIVSKSVTFRHEDARRHSRVKRLHVRLAVLVELFPCRGERPSGRPGHISGGAVNVRIEASSAGASRLPFEVQLASATAESLSHCPAP